MNLNLILSFRRLVTHRVARAPFRSAASSPAESDTLFHDAGSSRREMDGRQPTQCSCCVHLLIENITFSPFFTQQGP